MKRGILIISIIGLVIFQAFSQRNDRIFSASDELHYIVLYENGSEFEMLYNGLNTAKGTYIFKSDTILLTYKEGQFEEFDPNETLTRKILIDKETKRVKSIDNKKQFCANIEIDKRKIQNQP